MNFLVTNDDGIRAKGVYALVEVLRFYGKVYVICPSEERSAISHSITLRRPVSVKKVKMFGEGVEAWEVDGTPADCVKVGLDMLVKEPIDFVVSGLNLGANIGCDFFYSGTISAAAEASLYAIKSIAVSLDYEDEDSVDYTVPKRYLNEVMEILLSQNWPERSILNINIPYVSVKAYKGIVIVPLDRSIRRYKHVEVNHQEDQIQYWLKDQREWVENEQPDGDFKHLRDGFMTITPLEHKFGEVPLMDKVKEWIKSHSVIQ